MNLTIEVKNKNDEELVEKYKKETEEMIEDFKLIMLRKLKGLETEKRLLERKKKRIKTTEQRIEEFDEDITKYKFKEWDTGKPVGKEIW